MDGNDLDELNRLSYAVIGAAMLVHSELGPGLKETVYEAALAAELRKRQHQVHEQTVIPIVVGDRRIREGFKVDLIVDSKLLLEIKADTLIRREHIKQVASYLRFTNLQLGLILNFGASSLRRGIKRVINTR